MASYDLSETSASGDDPALEPPPISTSPGAEYGDDTRIFQGIPGIERAADGRLWALWYAGGPDEPGEGPGNKGTWASGHARQRLLINQATGNP